jgi:hypothetical protein
MLPKLVQQLVEDLTDAVHARIKLAFDMSKISKDASKGKSQSFLNREITNQLIWD